LIGIHGHSPSASSSSASLWRYTPTPPVDSGEGIKIWTTMRRFLAYVWTSQLVSVSPTLQKLFLAWAFYRFRIKIYALLDEIDCTAEGVDHPQARCIALQRL
jgi:hypothetical protein